MDKDFDCLMDPEEPIDVAALSALFQEYFDEVDKEVDAITDAETEARLAQLLNGSAQAGELAQDLAADLAGAQLSDEDCRLMAAADARVSMDLEEVTVSATALQAELALIRHQLKDAKISYASMQNRADQAREEAAVAQWEATIARVQAQHNIERADGYMEEARRHRTVAMERARTITDRAQDEAAAMITRAQAEVAAAMERAQQIVADANTLAELIKANAAVIAQADRNVLEGGEPAPGPEHAVPVTLTRLSLSYKATRHPIEDHNRFNLRGQPLRSGRFPSDAMALPIHSANSPGSIGNDVIAGATENDRCPSFDTWLPADVERSGSSVCRLSEALIGLDVMMRSDERILNHGSPAFYRSVRDLRPWSVLLVSGIGALVGGFAGNVICNGRLGGQPEVDRVFARGSAWSRPGTDAVLLRMIRMRRDGARASEISQSLNWDAVPTPSGLRKWTSADVVRLLCTSRATELISQMTANHGIARRLEETCSVG